MRGFGEFLRAGSTPAAALLLAWGLPATTAWGKPAAPAQPPAAASAVRAADPGVVATVDGQPVSSAEFAAYAAYRTHKARADLGDAEQQQVLERLVRIVAVAREARRQHVVPEVPYAHPACGGAPGCDDLNEELALVEQLGDSYRRGVSVDDAQLQAAYDGWLAHQPKLEYRAGHILVRSAAQAEALIGQLNAGASFADLAQQQSIDPSKSAGGEIGWFNAGFMIKPFMDAVLALTPGAITQQPVQSSFGFHVIQLEEVRPYRALAFEQVAPRLRQAQLRLAVDRYFDGLRGAAKVQAHLPSGSHPPASAALLPPGVSPPDSLVEPTPAVRAPEFTATGKQALADACSDAYPAASRRADEQGVVRLYVYIGPQGDATAATVLLSSGFERLDAAAISCVRGAGAPFVPYRVGSLAVGSWAILPYRWKLESAVPPPPAQ